MNTNNLQEPLPLLKKVKQTSFRSQYGGLWTDLSNAHELTKGKERLGIISPLEAENLHYFIDNGYVVLDSLIPSDIIDAFLVELDSIYRGEKEGFSAEIWVNNKAYYGVPYKKDYFGLPSLKLVDVHTNSVLARQINLYPHLTRYLSLIFERPVLAFQTLTFADGTQQPIHQDTAYVRIDSPMEMVATWIALEDISEGSGELEFFVGSHQLPDFPFADDPGLIGDEKWFPEGQSKWFNGKDEQNHRAYLSWLVEESEKRGFPRKKFRAKKGDVLIWTNDLAHGGSRIEDETLTRRSIVTHYCPLDCNPFYFYTHKHSEKIPHHSLGYYSYAYHEGQLEETQHQQQGELPPDFDSNLYLRLHPDVAEAGMDAEFHYLHHGIQEKRPYK